MYVQVFHLIRIKESLCKNTILIVKYFNESTVIQVHVCLTYFLIDTCMFSKILKKYIYKKKNMFKCTPSWIYPFIYCNTQVIGNTQQRQ